MQYTIIRSSRKSVSIQVTAEGEVIVRCPQKLSKKDIEQIVESKRPWIEDHLQKVSGWHTMPKLTYEEVDALADQALAELPGRVKFFAQKMGVTYGRITIRDQRTRWGSCSSSGNLNLNCLLMLTPPEVRDYVVVHELCHRKEMNHSPSFWAEVEAVLPNYKTQKKWLKDNGGAILARLPD